MLATLPLLVFLALFWLLSHPRPEDSAPAGATTGADWRAAFLKAAIAWGGLVVLLSEGLSLFHALSRVALAAGWTIALLGLLGLGWKKRRLAKPLIRFSALRGQKIDALFLAVPAVFFAVLALIAWLAPPNTNDSLSYHMSRVMHWVQNQGLQHYPTPINRQVWMPPWAEMAILQFQVLLGSDRLANFVQWFSAAASVIAVSLIAQRLGAGFGGQVTAAVFCATIPMGILQSSSTQNDYVVSFWIACLAYFTVVAHQRRLALAEWAWLSLAVALGMLTKGTCYAYALPLLGWLLASALRRERWGSLAGRALLGLVVVALVNGGAWARNLQTYRFPLGPPAAVQNLSNQSHTPAAMISNLARNAGLHLGTPYGRLNKGVMTAIAWLHDRLGQPLNDSAVTLKANKFQVQYSTHEDYAGNPVHFGLLFLFALCLPFFFARQRETRDQGLLYTLIVLSTFLLFSILYKWQSFGSRLQLPFFVLAAPLAGLAGEGLRRPAVRAALVAILTVQGISYLIYNPSRMLVQKAPGLPTLFNKSRDELLFANSGEIRRGYLSVSRAAAATGCRSIGLVIDSSDKEYPFWALLSPSGKEARLEHLGVSPPLDRYAPQDFQPCLVICTICGSDQWEGYRRISTHHGGIGLFAPAQANP